MTHRWIVVFAAGAAWIALALAGPATAQHMNAKDAPCRSALGTTSGAAACFSQEADAKDRELALMLDQVRPVLEGAELELLDKAQVAWGEYRRLACQSEYEMYGGGTGGPVTQAACLEAVTRDRIKQLHDAYDWRVAKHR